MTFRRTLLPRAAAAIVAAAALLALLAPAAAGAPPAVVVRVFALKNRAAGEALQLVRPLLSDAGSVMLDPKANELTVRDTAASVERAAQAVAAYDVPRVSLHCLECFTPSASWFGPPFWAELWTSWRCKLALKSVTHHTHMGCRHFL